MSLIASPSASSLDSMEKTLSEPTPTDSLSSLDALPHGFVRVDEHNTVVAWNLRMEQWTHTPRTETFGKLLHELFTQNPKIPRILEQVRTSRQPQILSQTFHNYFLHIPLPPQHISGFDFMLQEVHLKPLKSPAGHIAITIFDVTAEVVGQQQARMLRMELESARTTLAERVDELNASLREVDSLRFALDQAAIVTITDASGRITFANDKFCALTGHKREEITGQNHRLLSSDRHPESFHQALWKTIQSGNVWRGEICNRTADGDHIWLDQTIVPFKDETGRPERYISIGTDITTRVLADQAIVESLAEKEILLKEIHHRVKNNMQIISSMLQLQSSYIQEPAFKTIFANCQSRVMSMALVHEKLYRAKNLASIDFGEHIRDLSTMLVNSYASSHQKVDLNIQTDTAFVDIDTAVPVGLILNELITNSLKYGARADGTIALQVRLEKLTDLRLQISVSDQGPGLPAGFDLEKAQSLGLRMIRLLSRQIGGTIEIGSSRGSSFRIEFLAQASE